MKMDDLSTPETEMIEPNDELRPEYDLTQLQVRRLGPGRRQFGADVVRLEPDVAVVFPDADTANEALLLVKTGQSSNQPQYSV